MRGRNVRLVLVETSPPALSSGFLCVISLLSTFLSPLVTPSPLLRAANTPPISPAAAVTGAREAAAGAGGGGGGGAGATGGAELDRYVVASTPCTPRLAAFDGDEHDVYLGVPGETSGVVLHHILAKVLKESNEASSPFDLFWVPNVAQSLSQARGRAEYVRTTPCYP